MWQLIIVKFSYQTKSYERFKSVKVINIRFKKNKIYINFREREKNKRIWPERH